MKNNVLILLVLIMVSACTSRGPKQETKSGETQSKPNIILIVADDLGYSDIGPFGGDIQTPVLSKLATESMLFSNFHVLPTCSPTRSVLLTGSDNHIAGLGVMGEASYPELESFPRYSGHLSNQVVTISENLTQKGNQS